LCENPGGGATICKPMSEASQQENGVKKGESYCTILLADLQIVALLPRYLLK